MGVPTLKRWRVSLAVAALGLVAWGGIGFYQGLHCGFSGGLYDPKYVVPGVIPGTMADKAGFEPGDRVISVEGRPVEELGMESRWPRSLRPRIGQSHRFVVERKGERVTLNVVYGPPFREAVDNRIRAALVGLGFLGFGLWAFLTVRTPSALTLAHLGLAAGVAASFGLGPDLGSWNGVQGHVSTAFNVLTFILLLRFFVVFPRPKSLGENRIAILLIYGAWWCLVLFLVVELVVHPALYYATGSVAYPLMLVYGMLVFAAIIHSLLKTPRKEFRDSGMGWILAGFLVAILGIGLVPLVSSLNLPGWTFALPILAIPLTMALAVRRQARLEEPRVSSSGAAA